MEGGAPAPFPEFEQVGVVIGAFGMVTDRLIVGRSHCHDLVTLDRERLVVRLPQRGVDRLLQPGGDDGIPAPRGDLFVLPGPVAVHGILGEEVADGVGVVGCPRLDVPVEPLLDLIVSHGYHATRNPGRIRQNILAPVSDCCNASSYPDLFDAKEARRNLRRYEKRGLDGMGRALVDYLISRGLEGRTILEAGGGIGALQVELIESGAASAVNVELSSEYDEVASDLLTRRGIADRVQRRNGDFTDLAAGLEADDVILHRVICCYPFMERLMEAAMSSSKRFIAATFPRDRLGVKAVIWLENTWHKIRGVDFRGYVHDPEAIVETARSGGFEVVFRDRNLSWNAVVFERV